MCKTCINESDIMQTQKINILQYAAATPSPPSTVTDDVTMLLSTVGTVNAA
jgi:hypothetical protein